MQFMRKKLSVAGVEGIYFHLPEPGRAVRDGACEAAWDSGEFYPQGTGKSEGKRSGRTG